MKENEQAAVLATFAAALLVVVGYSGARGVERFFAAFVEIFGPVPGLRILAFAVGLVAALGGFAVFLGGVLIYQERVRTGRLLILIGSGAGFFSLVFFLVGNLRREEFSYVLEVLPGVVGVALGIAARFRARAKPLL